MPVFDPIPEPGTYPEGQTPKLTGGFPALDDDAAIGINDPNPVHWVEGKKVTVDAVVVLKAQTDVPPVDK